MKLVRPLFRACPPGSTNMKLSAVPRLRYIRCAIFFPIAQQRSEQIYLHYLFESTNSDLVAPVLLLLLLHLLLSSPGSWVLAVVVPL